MILARIAPCVRGGTYPEHGGEIVPAGETVGSLKRRRNSKAWTTMSMGGGTQPNGAFRSVCPKAATRRAKCRRGRLTYYSTSAYTHAGSSPPPLSPPLRAAGAVAPAAVAAAALPTTVAAAGPPPTPPPSPPPPVAPPPCAAATVAAAARDAASEHATTVATTVAATKYPSPQPPPSSLALFASVPWLTRRARALHRSASAVAAAAPTRSSTRARGPMATTGKTDIIQCQDGMEFNIYTNCHGDVGDCCSTRGGRWKCPSNLPVMCALTALGPCGGGTERRAIRGRRTVRRGIGERECPVSPPPSPPSAATLVAAARRRYRRRLRVDNGLGQRLHGHARVQPGSPASACLATGMGTCPTSPTLMASTFSALSSRVWQACLETAGLSDLQPSRLDDDWTSGLLHLARLQAFQVERPTRPRRQPRRLLHWRPGAILAKWGIPLSGLWLWRSCVQLSSRSSGGRMATNEHTYLVNLNQASERAAAATSASTRCCPMRA